MKLIGKTISDFKELTIVEIVRITFIIYYSLK